MKNLDDHGFIFNCLVYIAGFTTLFLFSYLKPHRYYKKIISFLFNLKFTWRGANWKVYHVMAFVTFLFILLILFLNMQLQMCRIDVHTDPTEKRLFKLNQKWLIESELWLTFLIIAELISIYKLATINDKRMQIVKDLGLPEDEVKEIENNY